MAWLDRRGSQFHLGFRYGGRKFKKSLGDCGEKEAQAIADRVERRLQLVEQGDLEIPPDADVLAFVISDGKRLHPVTPVRQISLGQLCSRYLENLTPDSLENESKRILNIHLTHIQRILGRQLMTQTLSFATLQNYVDVRCRETGRRGQPISPVTIKKELASLSGVWSWALRMELVKQAFPNRGLRFPKTEEKPAFMTWKEIGRRLAQGVLTLREQAELWDSLYLSIEELDELLDHEEQDSDSGLIYPMLLFAAHTGARRSEIVRSQVNDFDFGAGAVTIHEKKRTRGKRTTRTVPLSPKMNEVFKVWIANHPARWTFAVDGRQQTVDEATYLLKRSLSGTRWNKLRGWHVFRHSFISNCASKGVDQRMIDAWVGHTTEEMRRRYRHLLPDAQQAALASVFGGK